MSRELRKAFAFRATALVLVAVTVLLAYAPAASAQTPTPPTGGPEPNATQPHQETLEARVLSASPPTPCKADATGQNPVDPLTGKPQLCQKVELQVTKGSTK